MFNKFVSGGLKHFSLFAIFAIMLLSIVGFVYYISALSVCIFSLSLIVAFVLFKFNGFSNKYLWIFLICLGVLVRIWYAITVNVPILYDEEVCILAAQDIVQGDYSWFSDSYFQRWAYQIPFVLYEAIILKSFGTVRALYILNGIYSIATVMLIYMITKKIFNSSAALITTALYSLLPASIFRVSDLYNNVISGMIILIAIYLFVGVYNQYQNVNNLKSGKLLWRCFLIGLFLGISNLFRTETIICLLGVECWFIYIFISNAKKDNFLSLLCRILPCMIVTFAIYKLVNVSVDYYIIHSGISQNGIKNGCKYWFIVCGFTPESYGMFSEKYIDIVYIKDKHEQFEAFKRIMKEIFSNRSFVDIVKFFAIKATYMWGKPDFCLVLDENSYLYTLLKMPVMIINHIVYVCFFLLSAIGIKKNKINNFVMFLIITFIGLFLVYIIKEIGVQYRYYTIIIITLCSASGIDYLIKKKEHTINNTISKH